PPDSRRIRQTVAGRSPQAFPVTPGVRPPFHSGGRIMNTVAAPPPFTPEDLLALPDGDSFELVNGHLVERHMGAESSWIGGELYRLIGTYCRENQSGWVWPADGSYQCFPDRPNLVRKPDVSFIRRGRLPGEQLPRGHIRIQPDLAVEVVSPKDLF